MCSFFFSICLCFFGVGIGNLFRCWGEGWGDYVLLVVLVLVFPWGVYVFRSMSFETYAHGLHCLRVWMPEYLCMYAWDHSPVESIHV